MPPEGPKVALVRAPANIAFAQSPPGIGRKRPSLPGQPLGDPASGVPIGCRKCVPLAVRRRKAEIRSVAHEQARGKPLVMTSRTVVYFLAVALLAIAGATGCSTSISASDYDRSCEVDADCFAVPEGEQCQIERCGCASTAINVAEAEQYSTDLNSLVCMDPFVGFGPVCDCLGSVAVCQSGVCVGGPPVSTTCCFTQVWTPAGVRGAKG